jgi:hypothetical protein
MRIDTLLPRKMDDVFTIFVVGGEEILFEIPTYPLDMILSQSFTCKLHQVIVTAVLHFLYTGLPSCKYSIIIL